MKIRNLIAGILGVDQAEGPDISHHDRGFDPAKATRRMNFAIMKLTEGTTWVDPMVEQNWQGVRQVRVRGGYHYQRSGMSWALQVQNFLTVAEKYDFHFLALDVEGTFNTYSDSFFADTRRIVDELRKQTDKRILIYTNISTYNLLRDSLRRQYPDGEAWLNGVELWIAYPSSVRVSPPLPTGRTTWTIWQYSWTESGFGTVRDSGDANVFNGTTEQLEAWAGVTTSPDPGEPPKEEPVIPGKAREKLGKTSTIRLQPKVASGNDVGSISPYSEIAFTEIVEGTNFPGDKWFKLADGRGYVNYIYNLREYYAILSMPSPGTDPDPEPDPGEQRVEVVLDSSGVVTGISVDGAEVWKRGG